MNFPELERNIHSCWNILNEIEEVRKGLSEDNPVIDALVDICDKYDAKFERLYSTFDEGLFDTLCTTGETDDRPVQNIDLTEERHVTTWHPKEYWS